MARKLTSAERKALAVLGDRLPVCVFRNKDKFRSEAYYLANEGIYARWTDESKSTWEITFLGRDKMAKANKSTKWVKWCQEFRGDDAALRMIHALNTEGVKAGLALMAELRL